MALFRKKSEIEKFLNIASLERRALMNGDIDALFKVSDQKGKALDDLIEIRARLDKSELIDIVCICKDLQRLYRSAQDGLASAKLRLQALQRSGSSLGTYNAAGDKAQILLTSQEEHY